MPVVWISIAKPVEFFEPSSPSSWVPNFGKQRFRYMNGSKKSIGVQNESQTKIVSLNIQSSVLDDKNIKTKSNIKCEPNISRNSFPP